MSVCNVLVAEDRIAFYTDEAGYIGKEPVMLAPKVLVANGMMITTRGDARAGDLLADMLWRLPNVDDARAVMAEVLTNAPEAALGDGVEATLAGWADGPVCYRLTRIPPHPLKVTRMEKGWFMAPTLGDHAYPADITTDQAIRLAMLQQAIVRKHGMVLCVGGDLHESVVDADGARDRVVASYPDKADMIARIEARGSEQATASAMAA